MNKLRIIIILLSTVAVGFVMGFFMSGWLHHHRMKVFLEYRTESGFRQTALEVLSPEPSQLASLNPIIDEYARLNRELNSSYRRDLDALQMSYFSELEPYLTQNQIERLIGESFKVLPPSRSPEPSPANPQTGTQASQPPKNPPPTQTQGKLDTSAAAIQPTEPDTSELMPPPPGPGPRMQQFRQQERPNPEDRAERLSMSMKYRLSLDDSQYEQVRQINLDYAVRMKAIHEQYKGVDNRGMMEEINSLNNQRDIEMKAVLSPSQYDSYLFMMERIKKAWMDGRRRR